MCIVIDINALASVFNRSSADHAEFSPILTWILKGKGKLVYGGTKYKDELSKIKKTNIIQRMIAELGTAGKTIKLKDANVDNAETTAKKTIPDKEFNDPHIVAIIIVSKCCLVCTKDKQSIPFLKDLQLYPKDVTKPKLYTSKRNEDLLIDDNIAKICKR